MLVLNFFKIKFSVTSKFTRIHPASTSYNDGLTNGRNHFAVGDNDPLTATANALEGDYPDFQDPEFIFLSKQKLLLENEHIQLQVRLIVLNPCCTGHRILSLLG